LELISVAEAAKHKDCSRQAIWGAIKRGDLDAQRVGRSYIVTTNRRFHQWLPSGNGSVSRTVFRLGEFFSGPGGLARGALEAEVKANGAEHCLVHTWANDFDEDSCETYRKNLCPGSPETVIHEDVRKLDISALAPIDAFAFGFPCNDFSVVGEQRGIDGEFGPLYTYGVRLLEELRPQWFLAENVGGLKSSNDGNAFQRILSDLANSGYNLTSHLYKFEDYGVPQSRHRIIIIGIRHDLGLSYQVPKPTGNVISCREAIEDPPIPPDAPNNELTRQSPTVVERLQHIRPGENAWTADLPDRLKLNVKAARLSQIYKRLDPAKPAYTVTGSGGGGTHVYHWSEPRALTNRERARLQTFPDDHVFSGSKESVRKQIGMAVPVRGAKVIVEAVLKTFAGTDYPSVEPNLGYLTPGSVDQQRRLAV
jgi:DNA (cytosine-5)-methyltransferase 1